MRNVSGVMYGTGRWYTTPSRAMARRRASVVSRRYGGVRARATRESASGVERGVSDGAGVFVSFRTRFETGVRALGDEIFGAGGGDGGAGAGGSQREHALGTSRELGPGECVAVPNGVARIGRTR